VQLLAWFRAVGSLLLGVIGQLLFRRFGQSQSDAQWSVDGALDGLFTLSLQALPVELIWLVCGALCYVLAVLLWVQVLQQLTLARAYPLLSLAYPLVYCGAIVWLGEAATPQRTGGTLLVCLGVLLAMAPGAQQSNGTRRSADPANE